MPPRPKIQVPLDAYFTITVPTSCKTQSSKPPAPCLAKRKGLREDSDDEWTPPQKSGKTVRHGMGKARQSRSGKEIVAEKRVYMDDIASVAQKEIRNQATATRYGLPTPHSTIATPEPSATSSNIPRIYDLTDPLPHTDLFSGMRTNAFPKSIATPAGIGLQSPKATGPRRRSSAGEASSTVPHTPPRHRQDNTTTLDHNRGRDNRPLSKPGLTPLSQRIVPSSQQSDHNFHLPNKDVDELSNPFLAKEQERRQGRGLELAPLSSPLTQSSRAESIVPSGPGFKVPPLPLFSPHNANVISGPLVSPRKSSQTVASSQSQSVLVWPSPRREKYSSLKRSPSRKQSNHSEGAVPSSQTQEEILASEGLVRPRKDPSSPSRTPWFPDGQDTYLLPQLHNSPVPLDRLPITPRKRKQSSSGSSSPSRDVNENQRKLDSLPTKAKISLQHSKKDPTPQHPSRRSYIARPSSKSDSSETEPESDPEYPFPLASQTKSHSPPAVPAESAQTSAVRPGGSFEYPGSGMGGKKPSQPSYGRGNTSGSMPRNIASSGDDGPFSFPSDLTFTQNLNMQDSSFELTGSLPSAVGDFLDMLERKED